MGFRKPLNQMVTARRFRPARWLSGHRPAAPVGGQVDLLVSPAGRDHN
jgi:hypothetical protein